MIDLHLYMRPFLKRISAQKDRSLCSSLSLLILFTFGLSPLLGCDSSSSSPDPDPVFMDQNQDEDQEIQDQNPDLIDLNMDDMGPTVDQMLDFDLPPSVQITMGDEQGTLHIQTGGDFDIQWKRGETLLLHLDAQAFQICIGCPHTIPSCLDPFCKKFEICQKSR